MAAVFPGGVKSYTTLAAGDSIPVDLAQSWQDEITAVETTLLAAWTAYTPVWGNTGTGNTLGNSTIQGRYRKIGKTVQFKLQFVLGTTGSAGSAVYTFTLPATAQALFPDCFAAVLTDASVGNYTASAQLYLTDKCVVFAAGALAGVTGAAPFAWAVGDHIEISGTYEAA